MNYLVTLEELQDLRDSSFLKGVDIIGKIQDRGSHNVK